VISVLLLTYMTQLILLLLLLQLKEILQQQK
jgi:hypothetical protein